VTIATWLSRSLLGHIVVFEVIFGVPALLYGFVSNYVQGTLSAAFGAEMVVEIAALSAVGAAAVWYIITVPIMRRSKK